ncbi:MAG: DF family (seleno)protein [Solirubrobacterales bacterium]
MDVELLWWEGCPSTPEAIELVREELAALELDPEELRITEIRTDDEADRARFVGSPTIRVDGRDIQAPDDQPVGLTCRVYRWRDGRTAPLPERADVREALRQAKGGG